MEALPISAVILTHNEEKNLPVCLDSLRDWIGDVWVVDSGSTDATLEIARCYGARVVHHRFETHARQWWWALENVQCEHEWILALDADQSVTAELREEISGLFRVRKHRDGVDGFYVSRRQIFRGRWIRHGGYYPKYLLKLFRRDKARTDQGELIDHHFYVKGETRKLRCDIVEDNRKEADIAFWIEKHNRYARPQAEEEIHRGAATAIEARLLGNPDQRIAWRKSGWSYLPLYVRPLLYFLYRYVLRLGFLDGKEGFVFHFMQAFWYRLLVDIHLDELRRTRGGPSPASRSQDRSRLSEPTHGD